MGVQNKKGKYMLITVVYRDILTERFDSMFDAQAKMHEEMQQWGKIPEELFEAYKEYDAGDFGFGEDYGHSDNCGINRDLTYDWRIVKL